MLLGPGACGGVQAPPACRSGATGDEECAGARTSTHSRHTLKAIEGRGGLLQRRSRPQGPLPTNVEKPKAWPKSLLIFKRALLNALTDFGVRMQPFADNLEVLAVDREKVRGEFMRPTRRMAERQRARRSGAPKRMQSSVVLSFPAQSARIWPRRFCGWSAMTHEHSGNGNNRPHIWPHRPHTYGMCGRRGRHMRHSGNICGRCGRCGHTASPGFTSST
jgi:hypothetical protein